VKPFPGVFFAAVVLLIAVGCDPAFDYEPAGLSKVGEYQWGTRLDGVELRTRSLGALIGSRDLVPEFEIVNQTSELVAIEGARLITEQESYPADLPGEGEVRWRSAAPNTSARVSLFWEFEDAAVELLGDRPRIVLDLRIGEDRHQLEITYERVE
jgi:hypothetical protein